MRIPLPFLKGSQVCKENCLVGCRTGKAESHDRENAIDFRVARNQLFRFSADIARIRKRCALRGLNDEHQVALVILWNESPRHALVERVSTAEQYKENQQRCHAPIQRSPHAISVELRTGVEGIVESLEEFALRALPVVSQENRGERRCQ